MYKLTWWDATGEKADPWLGEFYFEFLSDLLKYIEVRLSKKVTCSIEIV